MKQKRFRHLIIVGLPVSGMFFVAWLLWLPMAADHQEQLNRDLILALKTGSIEEIQSLLEQGADPNARDLPELKPRGWIQQIIELVTQTRHPEIDRAPTVLCVATESGYPTQVVTLLLDRGANIKASETCDQPALFNTVVHGNLMATRLLLERGANANVHDSKGDTALQAALLFDNVAMIRLLLEHGARVQASDFDGAHSLYIREMLKNASKTR
jgi:ankyrin repeat protein